LSSLLLNSEQPSGDQRTALRKLFALAAALEVLQAGAS
jgi:hypothetical protein